MGGDEIGRVTRHAIDGTPLPPDLAHHNELYGKIRRDVAAMPHKPDVPWDYNDDTDAVPPAGR